MLVWGGGQRDDLGKSPHLARIGNSVFPDHCGDDDPKCMKFGASARSYDIEIYIYILYLYYIIL